MKDFRYVLSRIIFLILMDVQMPDMDGLQATALIREREQKSGGHTPIVALTAHTMKGDRERCLAAGMDEYVTKPIEAARLIEVVESTAALGRRRGKLPASAKHRPARAGDASRTEA